MSIETEDGLTVVAAHNLGEKEVEQLNQTLDRVSGWINNCDSKASIILGTSVAALAIIFTSDYVRSILNIVKDIYQNKCIYGMLYSLLILVSIALLSWGIWQMGQVLISKTDIKIFQQNGILSSSLLHFKSISERTFLAYKQEIENNTEMQYILDLESQIYICSKICTIKFNHYKCGIIKIALGFTGMALVLLIGLFLLIN